MSFKLPSYFNSKGLLFSDNSSHKALLKLTEYTPVLKPRGLGPLRSNSPKPFMPPLTGSPVLQTEYLPSQNSPDDQSNSNRKVVLPTLQIGREIKAEKRFNPYRPLKNQNLYSENRETNVRSITSPDGKPGRIRESASVSHLGNVRNSLSFKADGAQKENKVGKSESALCLNNEIMSMPYTRGCGLIRIYFNIPSQMRVRLPLLIVHFEGIVGSCLVAVNGQNKELQSEREKRSVVDEYLFVRKDCKNELRVLSKHFLVVVVFPFMSDKYKNAMKYMVNNKFAIDAAYYKGNQANRTEGNMVSGYILDYNAIIADFKAQSMNKKVVVLAPINLSPNIIRRTMLTGEDYSDEKYTEPYDKSSFLHFFPKVNIDTSNFRFICVPNLLMEERSEHYGHLRKLSFAGIAKLAMELLAEFDLETTIMKSQNTLDNEADEVLVPSKSISDTDTKQTEACSNPDDNSRALQTPIDRASRAKMRDRIEGFRLLDLKKVVKEIDKVREMNMRLKKVENIKEINRLKKEVSTFMFNQNSTRFKLIEDLAEMQKVYRAARVDGKERESVMIVGTVGDLYTNNAHLFKLYEKDKFYTNLNNMRVIDKMTEFLKQSGADKVFECEKEEKKCEEGEFRPERIMSKMREKVRISKNRGSADGIKKIKVSEEEAENSNIALIKGLADGIRVYL